jgi:hypothetical protein
LFRIIRRRSCLVSQPSRQVCTSVTPDVHFSLNPHARCAELSFPCTRVAQTIERCAKTALPIALRPTFTPDVQSVRRDRYGVRNAAEPVNPHARCAVILERAWPRLGAASAGRTLTPDVQWTGRTGGTGVPVPRACPLEPSRQMCSRLLFRRQVDRLAGGRDRTLTPDVQSGPGRAYRACGWRQPSRQMCSRARLPARREPSDL